jgi:type I restriction enzyme M protein
MTMLESWGSIDTAKKFIPTQEVRLHKKIQDDLDFKLSEIEIKYEEDIELAEKKVTELQEKKNPTKGQQNDLKKKKEALQKLIDKKNSEITDANAQAEKERIAIQTVKQELLEMFADPELRKRYFSIVDMDELEENEYNLNIPRYVDTFEPEEEIDLNEAIAEFNSVLGDEENMDNSLNELFNLIRK